MKYECSVISCLKMGLSGTVGAFLGFFTTVIVNMCLGIMAVSSRFAMYLGILFVAIGILMIHRINNERFRNLITKPHKQVYTASILIIVAGCCCFLLNGSTLKGLSYILKVPIFGYVGASIELGLLIAAMDAINGIFSVCQRNIDRAIIDGKTQAIYMIIVSGIIGAACGLTFGLFDIEDALGWEFIQLFVLEMGITMLVGAFVGFVGGLINEYLRQSGGEFKFEKLDNFEEEI